MISQLLPYSVLLAPQRYWVEFKGGFAKVTNQFFIRLKKFQYLYRFTRSKRRATRDAEEAFIEFIINTAANSPFGKDLRWQIESFMSKSRRQQIKLLPGFYLFVERYLFNSLETSKYTFREVLYQQFRVAIDQHGALKIIFLEPEKQKQAVCRRFLYSLARKSQRYQRTSNLGLDLQHWLDGMNSFTSFSKVTKKTGEELLIQIAQDFFNALCAQSTDRLALKIFNDSYDKQFLRYQNLECFHELLKLFPPPALDDTKYNLLSIQQMKGLLADKVEKLEKVSVELQEKNTLLANAYDEALAQSEQLHHQNSKLSEAQLLIQMMNDELASHSENLESKIQERTHEIAHKNELLVHYNNNLEQYTFAISHQLKAPIARILGLTNLLKMVPANEQPVIASSVHQSAKELNEVFKDLVHSLNFKKEAAELKSEQVELKDLLETVWSEVKKNTTQELNVEWKMEGNARLKTDRKHLVDALSQVYDNALKFRKPGSQAHITTAVRQVEGCLEIEIQDQGMGFDVDEVKPKLFTPFQRFNQTHTGRGMGLYFTKQHLTLLGGDIQIASSVNKGTKVKIQLPMK